LNSLNTNVGFIVVFKSVPFISVFLTPMPHYFNYYCLIEFQSSYSILQLNIKEHLPFENILYFNHYCFGHFVCMHWRSAVVNVLWFNIPVLNETHWFCVRYILRLSLYSWINFSVILTFCFLSLLIAFCFYFGRDHCLYSGLIMGLDIGPFHSSD
jgi:hypothetical protein